MTRPAQTAPSQVEEVELGYLQSLASLVEGGPSEGREGDGRKRKGRERKGRERVSRERVSREMESRSPPPRDKAWRAGRLLKIKGVTHRHNQGSQADRHTLRYGLGPPQVRWNAG
jgi:hypothetical protein